MAVFQLLHQLRMSDGTLAPSYLDLSFYLRNHFPLVSGIVPAGLCLGATVDFLNGETVD
ncbi:hypothetical protein Pla144_44120 [Bythopirellula polymerisocia]|uniref:Uncharacterized protein n=1 Tax=Bythopirellula polymerisocia TaxID=2528003 RepID=A0A5C6CD15_9BACT|nr:hypothetical protein Pla144_44120 [Bythopirellula polymerisocia]